MVEPCRYHTCRTLADLWGVSGSLVYKLVETGQLGHIRIGNLSDQLAVYGAVQRIVPPRCWGAHLTLDQQITLFKAHFILLTGFCGICRLRRMRFLGILD